MMQVHHRYDTVFKTQVNFKNLRDIFNLFLCLIWINLISFLSHKICYKNKFAILQIFQFSIVHKFSALFFFNFSAHKFGKKLINIDLEKNIEIYNIFQFSAHGYF